MQINPGKPQAIPDNTPVIISAGQYTAHPDSDSTADLSSPMDLAAFASERALKDAGGKLQATDIDTIATIRLFADSAPAWSCPFGGSDNPPESIARRIGATPEERIYSTANGAQPLQLLAELFTRIARGETGCALLVGAEAIANQRFAQRTGLTPDWSELFELPLDSREESQLIASPQEFVSGMYLPAHYYAVIENCRAAQRGNNLEEHRKQMARLLAPFSEVASHNPYAYWQDAYNEEALLAQDRGNYPISLPYSKRMVAQDAVNQAAALVLTSAGKARELGVSPTQWIFLQGYAEGMDHVVSQRENPGASRAMELVFGKALDSAQASGRDFELIDIYSCFPCAVEAACNALGLPIDGDPRLTVTGGLPFFGGPGNNYSMHALAEMTRRLRGSAQRALVTANGGILSKHAAAVLANDPGAGGAYPLDFASGDPIVIDQKEISRRSMADQVSAGTAISYTVIYERNKADRSVILGETATGERFLASTEEPAIVEAMKQASPIGKAVAITTSEGKNTFSLPD